MWNSSIFTRSRPVRVSSTLIRLAKNYRAGPYFRSFSLSCIRRSHENPLGLPNAGKATSRMSRGLPVKQKIKGVKRVVLVSSAKGGVGKSTVSVNLALALQHSNKRVGILDADVFGPSIPRLLSLRGEPRLSPEGKLYPMINYGLSSMSMGYLVRPEDAVVWRGLMVMKALNQLLFEVDWTNGGADLDYLIVDMPPGTGDTQLTIAQQLVVDGAVIVSTPQDIALIDAVKGITMMRKVNIPILGMVQNMSFFICPNCNHESHIFGHDGAKTEAEKQGIKLLGSIPLNPEICTQSDKGKPITAAGDENKLALPYFQIAREVIKALEV